VAYLVAWMVMPVTPLPVVVPVDAAAPPTPASNFTQTA
jgi:hypothetical protein